MNESRTLKRMIFFMTAFFVTSLTAQEISGKIVEKSTGAALVGANVIVKNTFNGATSDEEGKFTLKNIKDEVIVVATYIGFKPKEMKAKAGDEITFEMEDEVFGETVVVSGSRKSETILESPVMVEKIDAIAIKNAPKANFYEAIGNYKAIDITTASIAFPVVNMRGFNSTSPDRFVQFVDGMDNQAPALNFPFGNMVGMSELDLEAVEIVYGASSALYGANAFNGVLSMNSKSAWDYQGLSMRFKSGSRGLMDGALRYAKAFDNTFAFKINVSYIQADDWEADNPKANYYGKLGVVNTQNISTVLNGALLANPTSTALNGFKNYTTAMGLNLASANLNVTNTFAEKDLVEYDMKNLKVNTSLYYRLSEYIQASYTFNYGDGNGVYQGANRYNIKNFNLQQHKIQVDRKHKEFSWTLKYYTTIDNAGDTYDAVFTAVNLNKMAAVNKGSTYFGNFLTGLVGATASASNNFTTPINQATYNALFTNAYAYANDPSRSIYFKKGTAEFDNAFNSITTNSNLAGGGSKFVDNSSLSTYEGQFNTNQLGLDINAGANYRVYDPESDGTIFRDGSWQPIPGNDVVSKSLGDISVYEWGMYLQLEKKFNRFKFTVSGRMDKHENFDYQYSPRATVQIDLGNKENYKGNIRFSYLTAFRNPSLQDQYIGLDVVQAVLWGNAFGFDRGYDIRSVMLGSPKKVYLEAVKPEKVSTFEIGYKSIIDDQIFVDMSYYRSKYIDFIVPTNVLVPNLDNPVNFATGGYRVYQVDGNADTDVEDEGFALGINYTLDENYSVNSNYSYAMLINSLDPTRPSDYNTPKNKWNFGFSGRNLSGFGFNVNVKHVDGFYWTGSTSFTGYVKAYELVDLAVLYDFNLSGQDLSAKLAISNLLDNQHFQAYGAPTIGRMIVVQLSTEF